MIVTVDRRRRISLGKMAKHWLYRAEVGDDGVIVLTPVVPVPLSDIAAQVDERHELQKERRAKDIQLADARHEILKLEEKVQRLTAENSAMFMKLVTEKKS